MKRVKIFFNWLISFTKREVNETEIAGEILIKIMKGEDVTQEQIKFLKEQSIDCGKVLMIIGVQVIPGSSAGLIALEMFGKKHGFTIFPKEHEIPKL